MNTDWGDIHPVLNVFPGVGVTVLGSDYHDRYLRTLKKVKEREIAERISTLWGTDQHVAALQTEVKSNSKLKFWQLLLRTNGKSTEERKKYKREWIRRQRNPDNQEVEVETGAPAESGTQTQNQAQAQTQAQTQTQTQTRGRNTNAPQPLRIIQYVPENQGGPLVRRRAGALVRDTARRSEECNPAWLSDFQLLLIVPFFIIFLCL